MHGNYCYIWLVMYGNYCYIWLVMYGNYCYIWLVMYGNYCYIPNYIPIYLLVTYLLVMDWHVKDIL